MGSGQYLNATTNACTPCAIGFSSLMINRQSVFPVLQTPPPREREPQTRMSAPTDARLVRENLSFVIRTPSVFSVLLTTRIDASVSWDILAVEKMETVLMCVREGAETRAPA